MSVNVGAGKKEIELKERKNNIKLKKKSYKYRALIYASHMSKVTS